MRPAWASSAWATSGCPWRSSLPAAASPAPESTSTRAKSSAIERGESYIPDVPSADVQALRAAGRLSATTDFSVVAELDTINICVPTPLRKTKDPDMSYIVSAVEAIAAHLHPGMLVVLESTTYPGTTEEVVQPLLERGGLKAGVDFFLAFSPERVDPGNSQFHTRNVPKVIGGTTPECAEVACALYGTSIDTVVPVSSPRVAEMVKLLENTFRAVNIGLVNEIALMCDRLGINVWEVVDAAKTKPFGFMPFYPGPGLGGHCIPIDPFYLSWKAKQYGFEPRFIELAGHVNGAMPHATVDKIADALNVHKKALNGATRARRRHRLQARHRRHARVAGARRHGPAPPEGRARALRGPARPEARRDARGWAASTSSRSRSTRTRSPAADCVAILTDHSAFDYDALVAGASLIVDTRNAIKQAHANVFKLGAPAASACGSLRAVRRHRRTGRVVEAREPGWNWSSGCRRWASDTSTWAIPRCSRSGLRSVRWPSVPCPTAPPNRRACPSSWPRATKRRACRRASTTSWRSTTRPIGAKSSSCPTDRPTARSMSCPGMAICVQTLAAPAIGKAAALNLAIAQATGDVLVFADARQMFAPDALRALVAPLADPAVGGVTGELILDCEATAVAGRRSGERRRPDSADQAAVRQERTPARRATAAAGTSRPSAKASGCTGATRSSCGGWRAWSAPRSARRARSTRCAVRCIARFRPTPSSTTCSRRCGRCSRATASCSTSAPSRSIERPSDARAERRRKVRTLAGNFQILWQEPRLLAAGRQPGLAAVRLAQGRTAARPVRAVRAVRRERRRSRPAGVFYSLTLAAQCVVYLLGGYGAWLDSQQASPARPAATVMDRARPGGA